MTIIAARCGLTPALRFVLFGLHVAALVLALGTADARHRSDRPKWPVTSAEALRSQPAEAQTSGAGRREAPTAEAVQDVRGGSPQPARHAAAVPGRRASGLAAAPSCLPAVLTATLRKVEEQWGPVTIISAHRPGARIRGTGKRSLHASCRAVDFRPPKGSYRAVAAWLKRNHAGGVGTYAGNHNHIHIDARPCEPGTCYRWHN